VQLAARQGGFEHIAGIHRAFGLAGANERVQLVDKDDGAAFILGEFIQYSLQALFEFAAILGARDQRGEIKHEQFLVLERFGYFAVDDALGEAFDNGGLAHARLADQYRIILGAALQHLDRAADFVVAADYRIELAGARALGQIQAIFGERFALTFSIRAVHRIAATHRVDRRQNRFRLAAMLFEQLAGFAFVLGQRKQVKIRGDELVIAFHRHLVDEVQKLVELRRNGQLGIHALHLGQAFDCCIERGLERRDIDAGSGEQGASARFGIVEQREQQMLWLDIGIVVAVGEALGIGQGLLEFGGEFVKAHGNDPPKNVFALNMGAGGVISSVTMTGFARDQFVPKRKSTGTRTQVSSGLSPRRAGLKRQPRTASTAASSSSSWPLLVSTRISVALPLALTRTFSTTLPSQPRCRARRG